MPYKCIYCFKEIPNGEAVTCSKCKKKPFHKNCFEKHNKEEHDGKAKAKAHKEIAGTNIGSVKIGNRIIKP